MKILYHTLFDPSKLKAISNSFKSKNCEKLKSVFLLSNLSCLLPNLNKLFIAFKAWSKHLKLERNLL